MTDPAAAVEAVRARLAEHWYVNTASALTDMGRLLRAYEAVVHENVGLKHTLEVWDQECGGKSPREYLAEELEEQVETLTADFAVQLDAAVAQAVREERDKHTFPFCEDSGHAICYQCAAAVRRPQEGT
jgi:hypothetical protein